MKHELATGEIPGRQPDDVGASDHWHISNAIAFESVVLSGAGNPGSRPHHCAHTSVPGVRSVGSGEPPSSPCANDRKSIEYAPLQSFVGAGVPPEFTAGVRFTGELTHSVPPWNGLATDPVVP